LDCDLQSIVEIKQQQQQQQQQQQCTTQATLQPHTEFEAAGKSIVLSCGYQLILIFDRFQDIEYLDFV
jgi:hypothetical protein